MDLIIESVDYAPNELYGQVPLRISLLREIPGPDRPDYWIGAAVIPIQWIENNLEKEITHVVLAARWVGTRIEPGVQHLPVGIAYVTDPSLLEDQQLDFKKCRYIAIGLSHDSSRHKMRSEKRSILSGRITRAFGKGQE